MSGTQFDLIGIDPKAKGRTTETKIEHYYNQVPYHHKEHVNFPHRYDNLSVDQKFFVDSLFETCYISFDEDEIQTVEEEVTSLTEYVDEIKTSVNNLLNVLSK
tara:strand:+ start:74 stop:382 length:309 start_codon:yes stop_codon:yes gene_type:complete